MECEQVSLYGGILLRERGRKGPVSGHCVLSFPGGIAWVDGLEWGCDGAGEVEWVGRKCVNSVGEE